MHAQGRGGTCHPIERPLWSDEHTGLLGGQYLSERRRLRCNRDGRSGNPVSGDDTGEIEDGVTVEGGDVDRLAELPG